MEVEVDSKPREGQSQRMEPFGEVGGEEGVDDDDGPPPPPQEPLLLPQRTETAYEALLLRRRQSEPQQPQERTSGASGGVLLPLPKRQSWRRRVFGGHGGGGDGDDDHHQSEGQGNPQSPPPSVSLLMAPIVVSNDTSELLKAPGHTEGDDYEDSGLEDLDDIDDEDRSLVDTEHEAESGNNDDKDDELPSDGAAQTAASPSVPENPEGGSFLLPKDPIERPASTGGPPLEEMSSAQNAPNAKDVDDQSLPLQPPVVLQPLPSFSAPDVDEPPPSAPVVLATPPTLEELLTHVDEAFHLVPDPLQVTVRDVLTLVEQRCGASGGANLTKPRKAAIRARLTELVAQWQQQQEEEEKVTDNDGENGDDASDSEREEDNSDDDDEEEAPNESEEDDDDDEEYTTKQLRKGVRKNQKKTSSKQAKPSSSKKKVSIQSKEAKTPSSARPRRPLKSDSRAKALRLHAEKLRKRRLEELRVRNEELQLEEGQQQDKKRAEEIAAKFDTDTDELRFQRLEQRIGLLSKLDEKRLTVVQQETVVELSESSEDDGDDSDDDDDLEVEGWSSNLLAPHVRNRDALSLLQMADHRACRRHLQAHLRPTGTVGSSSSPSRALQARAALKNSLLQRRRQQSNRWLARELGYKSEKEHLKDCLEAEHRKQALILQRERDRLEHNKRIRERLLDGADVLDDDEAAVEDTGANPSPAPAAADDEEEDEEMVMARELKSKEQDSDDREPSSTSASHFREDKSSMGENAGASAMPIDDVSSMMGDTDIADDGGPTESNVKSQVAALPDVTPTATASSYPSASEFEVFGANDDGASDADTRSVSEPAPSPGDAPVPAVKKPQGPRNAAWKALLEKDAAQAKRMKARKSGLVEDEADEEEDEQQAGLEDFGFTVHKKKKEDEENEDDYNEDDLKGVVDDLSDDEGDEDAGERARKALEKQEEKERHKEILRRMRDGYDGRRGGIASGGFGARGVHRFDELVAADNREDAKRLGLLNDDELESDGEEAGEKASAGGDDEDDDEAALLDKMLKDRFLHRSSVEMEENFSDDEEEIADEAADNEGQEEDAEDREQERLAKRFAKRARMQRVIEAHAHDEEFSQSKLIDDDASLKLELQKMKVTAFVKHHARLNQLCYIH